MLKCKFISTGNNDSLEELKIASLYYDEIDVLKNIVYTLTPLDENGMGRIRGVHECFDAEFEKTVSVLTREKIANIEETRDVRLQPADPSKRKNHTIPSELENKLYTESQKLIAEVGNKAWDSEFKDGKLVGVAFSPEVNNVHKAFLGELSIGATLDLEFLDTYYSNLLFYTMKFLQENQNLVNSSYIIDTYFNLYHTKNLESNADLFKKYGKPEIGTEAIKYFVPNVSNLAIEDILEIRLKLRDELENYRYYVNELNNNLKVTDNLTQTNESVIYYLDNKINPGIKDLKNKILSTKLSVAQNFLNEVKNPKSYTPIIGNIFLDISAHISLLLSVGLIGTSTFLKWKEKNLEHKNNGLYYLLKLRNRV